jgi:hypothetical protein
MGDRNSHNRSCQETRCACKIMLSSSADPGTAYPCHYAIAEMCKNGKAASGPALSA